MSLELPFTLKVLSLTPTLTEMFSFYEKRICPHRSTRSVFDMAQENVNSSSKHCGELVLESF